jgi:hypothetical protein
MKIHFFFIAAICIGCNSSDMTIGSPLVGDDATPGAIADAQPAQEGSVAEDFIATVDAFDCSHNSEWTTVGLAHYKNVLGHTDQMLAAARSESGGTYPVGTIVQLNPAEAMVKRGSGFDATSNDWEFFTLTGLDAGVSISNHGGGTSVSNARATCLSCHLPAQTTFDLICGDPVEGGATTTHGCMALPVPTSVLANLPDARCP